MPAVVSPPKGGELDLAVIAIVGHAVRHPVASAGQVAVRHSRRTAVHTRLCKERENCCAEIRHTFFSFLSEGYHFVRPQSQGHLFQQPVEKLFERGLQGVDGTIPFFCHNSQHIQQMPNIHPELMNNFTPDSHTIFSNTWKHNFLKVGKRLCSLEIRKGQSY